MGQIPDHAPARISEAMRTFITGHPRWDHYRLMQAAVAGFLVQHGCHDRAVSRHYLNGLFQRDTSGQPHDLPTHG